MSEPTRKRGGRRLPGRRVDLGDSIIRKPGNLRDGDPIEKVKATALVPKGAGWERLLAPDDHYLEERLFRVLWQSRHEGPAYSSGDLLAHVLNQKSTRFLFGSMDAVSARDREVAASVVQWLGTPIGWGFLQSVFDAAGRIFDQGSKPEPLPRKVLFVGGERSLELEG